MLVTQPFNRGREAKTGRLLFDWQTADVLVEEISFPQHNQEKARLYKSLGPVCGYY